MDPEEIPLTPRCLLLGSGEFEPWAAEAERAALSGAAGNGDVVVLATASAPEGETTFGRWNEMGIGHYQSLGLPVRALPVRTREDAQVAEHAATVRESSLIFFSEGTPSFSLAPWRAPRCGRRHCRRFAEARSMAVAAPAP